MEKKKWNKRKIYNYLEKKTIYIKFIYFLYFIYILYTLYKYFYINYFFSNFIKIKVYIYLIKILFYFIY